MSLYKGNGSRSCCNSYRPISLLSVPGKVFAHVLLARLQPLLDRNKRPQQSGFTAGRTTVDTILALRLLSELGAYIMPSTTPRSVYIDVGLKAVFDSVDRAALWKALKGAPLLMHLLRGPYAKWILLAIPHLFRCATGLHTGPSPLLLRY